MKTVNYVVTNRLGVHARPCAIFAQKCTEFQSIVAVKSGDKQANGRNVLELMKLNLKKGDSFIVEIEGVDEEACEKAILGVLKQEFDDDSVSELFKIAFFGTKEYDRIFFNELTKEMGEGTYNTEIQFLDSNLSMETVALAAGNDAVCIFVNADANGDVVRELHKLGIRLILLRCAGFNNVDLEAAKECGITVMRVPAYSPYAVAEHAMAILQQANRRIHKSYTKMKDNNFALNGLLGLDLHNKVAGIVGTGRIGVCMANICKGYGMKIIAWDAFPNKALEEQGLLTYVEKEELFKQADLISLHAPLFPNTRHMINEETIAMMKDTAMLVNTSRGGLIDTEALIQGLKGGKFHAVALDVYEGEDSNVYADRSNDVIENCITARLLSFPQVVLTSHQAFFTREAMQAIAVVTMENARNFKEGNDLGIAEVK